MGASILLWSNPRKNEENGRKWERIVWYFLIFLCFFKDFLAKIGPRACGIHSWTFWQSLSVFQPLPTQFTPLFLKKNAKKKGNAKKNKKCKNLKNTRFSISWRIQASGPCSFDKTSKKKKNRLNESSVRPNATLLVKKQNSERKSTRKQGKQSHNPYPWVEKCKPFTLAIFFG